MSITYKIGEAAALLNLKTYVLRFWETEFPDIAPLRTEKGQRLYAGEHLALLERIRFLLHERGLTIEGARRILAEEKKRGVSYRFSQGGETKNSLPPTQPPVHWPGEKPPAVGRTATYGSPAVPPPAPVVREPIKAMASFPQHNLPGIVQGAPCVADSLDRASRTEYCHNEREEAARASLPLFGMGKAARLSGDLPDKTATINMPETPQGGDNFLAAGLEGAPGARVPGFAFDPVHPSGKREFLRDLAVELERIAALLRPEK